MSWKDHGTIFKVRNISSWIRSHAYVPTAIELADRIRVFVAFWDDNMYGRLGYIDLDLSDPTIAIGYSEEAVVADSKVPAFDRSGITPLCVVTEDDHIKLYYAGWNNSDDSKVRYQLFTGLLIGDKTGCTFKRYDANPVIQARNSDENVRTGGQVIKTEDGYRCYLATQKGTHNKFSKSLPIYDLECAFSQDGYNWKDEQYPIFQHKKGEILGFGRSAIWRNRESGYEGLFAVRNWDGSYSDLLYSASEDGLNWEELQTGKRAFLSSMTSDQQKEVSFPSLIFKEERILMFYNGDNFGKDGLRLAIWE